MTTDREIVEWTAEALWAADAERCDQSRKMPWHDIAETEREKWRFMARASIDATGVMELREALELVLPLAKGYSPEGQTPKAKQTCRAWIQAADAALNQPDREKVNG